MPAVQAKAKTVLPDACGDDGIKFDVTTQKNEAVPAGPAQGKAQIVFVEDEPSRVVNPFGFDTVRFGLDGAWAGANNGNSYFVLEISPGEHHLCATPQTKSPELKKSVEVASFTAEPGKIYYFSAKLSMPDRRPKFEFSKLTEDEGKYRVKAYKVATWKTNK